MLTETGREHWVSSLVTLPHILLMQGLSLLEPGGHKPEVNVFHLGWQQKYPIILLFLSLLPQRARVAGACETMPSLLCGCWDLNSAPNGFRASTLNY